MAVPTNRMLVDVIGLELLQKAIESAGGEEWLKGVQEDWTQIATPKVQALTPRRTGNLAGSTEGLVRKKDRGTGSKYPAVVRQSVQDSRGKPYAGFVEMKPQKRRYMLETANRLMPFYRSHLSFHMGKYLKKIGLK